VNFIISTNFLTWLSVKGRERSIFILTPNEANEANFMFAWSISSSSLITYRSNAFKPRRRLTTWWRYPERVDRAVSYSVSAHSCGHADRRSMSANEPKGLSCRRRIRSTSRLDQKSSLGNVDNCIWMKRKVGFVIILPGYRMTIILLWHEMTGN